MTELINDEAVYRTAPATPGLLNIMGTITRTVFLVELSDVYERSRKQFYVSAHPLPKVRQKVPPTNTKKTHSPKHPSMSTR